MLGTFLRDSAPYWQDDVTSAAAELSTEHPLVPVCCSPTEPEVVLPAVVCEVQLTHCHVQDAPFEAIATLCRGKFSC